MDIADRHSRDVSAMKDVLIGNGSLVSMAIMHRKNGVVDFMPFKFDNDEEIMSQSKILAHLLKRFDVFCYSLVSEAWAVRGNFSLSEKYVGRPSEDPNRIEVLSVHTVDRDENIEFTVVEMDRDSDGNIVFGEEEKCSSTSDEDMTVHNNLGSIFNVKLSAKEENEIKKMLDQARLFV